MESVLTICVPVYPLEARNVSPPTSRSSSCDVNRYTEPSLRVTRQHVASVSRSPFR